MKTISSEQFEKTYGQKAAGMFTQSPSTLGDRPVGDRLKDIAIGAGKGAASSVAFGVDVGQRILGAATPGITYSDIKTEANQNPTYKKLTDQELLKSSNQDQSFGKALEFAGELLWPVGKVGEIPSMVDKVGQKTGASFDKIGSKIASISDDVAGGGSKIKENLIDMVSKIDDKTKTALSRTPKDVFDDFVNRGKNAMLNDQNQTPLEYVGEKVVNGLKQVKELASAAGSQKSELTKIPNPFEGNGISEFRNKLTSFLNSRNLIENDKTVVKQIVSQFNKLGNSPSQGQVDKFIDFAQDLVYAGEKNLTLPTSNSTTAQLKGLIGGLNRSLKSQMPKEFQALNDKYSKFISLSNELNTKLGREGANAGSIIKRLFSPSDARTKELFKELGDITGDDYFRDARLAKFVMESLGDNRAASLLEQIPHSIPSAKGIIEKGIDYGLKKLNKPLDSAEKYLKENIAPQVIQAIDPKTGEKSFYRVKKSDFPKVKELIDGANGIAGKITKGKVYHLTTKPPESMTANGFVDKGVAKIKGLIK